MNVKLVSHQPVVEVTKANGRARRGKRGVRKGRHMVRTRVKRGQARARWAVVNERNHMLLGRTFETRADAMRAMEQTERALSRIHESVRAFVTA
jgi:hypothetical protein